MTTACCQWNFHVIKLAICAAEARFAPGPHQQSWKATNTERVSPHGELITTYVAPRSVSQLGSTLPVSSATNMPCVCCEAKPLPVCFCVGGFVVWWSKFAHSSIISIDPPRSLSFPFDSISTSSGLTRSLSKVISLEKIGTGS
jgi:hypothetical protein